MWIRSYRDHSHPSVHRSVLLSNHSSTGLAFLFPLLAMHAFLYDNSLNVLNEFILDRDSPLGKTSDMCDYGHCTSLNLCMIAPNVASGAWFVVNSPHTPLWNAIKMSHNWMEFIGLIKFGVIRVHLIRYMWWLVGLVVPDQLHCYHV